MSKVRLYYWVTCLVICAFGLFMLMGLGCNPEKKVDSKTLVSVKTDTPPILDGVPNDPAWEKANALKVTLDQLPYTPDNGYEGMKKTDIVLKSVYTEDKIYFYASWNDPTLSLARFPWEKQVDGSWKQLKNLDQTKHDNTYYEDKMSIYWDIQTSGMFKQKGCLASCHENVDYSAGRKYTAKPGESIDMWHWKSVRTDPVGYFDDQFVYHNQDPTINKNWGRKSDHSTGGGYTDNKNETGTLPAWQNGPNGVVKDTTYWILDEDKVPFQDTFQPGDQIAGVVISPLEDSRADIQVSSLYKASHDKEGTKEEDQNEEGTWHLEFVRNLTTSGEESALEDVQFSDKQKTYYFGVSVFDNSQINHLYHNGVLKLVFSDKE